MCSLAKSIEVPGVLHQGCTTHQRRKAGNGQPPSNTQERTVRVGRAEGGQRVGQRLSPACPVTDTCPQAQDCIPVTYHHLRLSLPTRWAARHPPPPSASRSGSPVTHDHPSASRYERSGSPARESGNRGHKRWVLCNISILMSTDNAIY